VAALKRVGYGPLTLGRLGAGGARRLSDDEIARLWKDAE
jgi:16S rRNA U516 pseudouridylate synthase RsuA-like enzyme